MMGSAIKILTCSYDFPPLLLPLRAPRPVDSSLPRRGAWPLSPSVDLPRHSGPGPGHAGRRRRPLRHPEHCHRLSTGAGGLFWFSIGLVCSI